MDFRYTAPAALNRCAPRHNAETGGHLVPLRMAMSITGIMLTLAAGVLAARWMVGGSAEVPRLSQMDLEALSAGPGARWTTVVSAPDGPPRIHAGEVDSLGRAVTVSCNSCHANIESNTARRSAEDPPMQFHQGLRFSHGGMSCVSCHNTKNYDTLRLADGSAVTFPNVMNLCAQCHTPQARDWERGAHGGMTGYWDLTRGGRLRKNCIDCHDPHAPEFPSMRPTFKPRDRFLHPGHSTKGSDHD
jgi:hypothetical protein